MDTCYVPSNPGSSVSFAPAILPAWVGLTLPPAVVAAILGSIGDVYDYSSERTQFAAAYFATGDFAAGVFAIASVFAAGVFAAGLFATGFVAAGVYSAGVFSVGVISGDWLLAGGGLGHQEPQLAIARFKVAING